MPFQLFSSDFQEGQPIPRKFSCDELDVSPQLSWKDAPSGTSSFALTLHDPDAPAGDWVHWILFNIPASSNSLPEGIPADKVLADGTLQGRNSWHQVRYGGPCPPGGTHRYFFELNALDCLLNLDAGAGCQELLYAMQGHILAQAKLMGTYSRQK